MDNPKILTAIGKFVESLANVDVAMKEIRKESKAMLDALTRDEEANMAAYEALFSEDEDDTEDEDDNDARVAESALQCNVKARQIACQMKLIECISTWDLVLIDNESEFEDRPQMLIKEVQAVHRFMNNTTGRDRVPKVTYWCDEDLRGDLKEDDWSVRCKMERHFKKKIARTNATN